MTRTSQMIFETLETEIYESQLSPGDVLEEVALAERFNVSRTPIREALQSLMNAHLAERLPDRTVRVAQYSPRRLLEMFSTMALMDAEAAYLAARRATPEQIEELAGLQENCRTAALSHDSAGYYANNSAFHRLIRRIGGNQFLEDEAGKLHKLLFPYLRTQFRARDRVDDSIAEHDAIVEAIRNARVDDARDIMRGHIEIRGDRMLDLMTFFGDDRRNET